MKKISVLFMAIIASIVCVLWLPAQAQDAATSTPAPTDVSTLRDLVLNPDCENSCWLGIEPGMTQEEMVARLDASGVVYETSDPTAEGGQITYNVMSDYSHPDVSPDEYAVVIWLDQKDDGLYHVEGIEITLKDVSVEEMVSVFGAPEMVFQYVRQSPRPSTFEVSYPSLGIVFRVANLDQANVVVTAYAMSKESILKAYQYNPEFSGVYVDCDAEWQICAVPTATPVPESLPPAVSSKELSEIVTSPDCASACWLGIYAGMSEEEMVAQLEVNNLSYSIQSLDGDTLNYRITEGYNNLVVAPGFRNSILIWVSHNPESEPVNAVVSVELLLNDIPLSNLLSAFGAPTQILGEDDYGGTVAYLVYEGQGLVFTVAYDRVRAVDLLADLTGYTDFYEPSEACSADLQTCSLATATPTAP